MPVFSSIAAATIAGGAIAGGAAVGGALINKGAQEDATNAQIVANRESIAAQKEMAAQAEKFQREQADLARKDLEPFRQAQLSALGQLQGLSQADNPIYQAQRQQNTEAIQRQLAAQGLLRSKSQVDLLSNLELGLNQQRIGTLSGLANSGAAQGQAQISNQLGNSLGAIYGNLGNTVGQSIQNRGQALASGFQNQGALSAGALTGVANAFQGTAGNLQQLALYKKLGLLDS